MKWKCSYLRLHHNNIENLHGLENCIGIRCLSIDEEKQFLSFEGIGKTITSFPEGLFLHMNEVLEDFRGLENITSIGPQKKEYYDNDTRVSVGINTWNCYKLRNCKGLNNVKECFDVDIKNNYVMENLEGLESLEYVHEDFSVYGNGNLIIDGVNPSVHIKGTLSVFRNKIKYTQEKILEYFKNFSEDKINQGKRFFLNFVSGDRS